MASAALVSVAMEPESGPGTARKTSRWSLIRSLFIDLPVVLLFTLLLSALLVRHCYTTLITPLVHSYRRQPMDDGFYDEFRNEFTYYNRHCDASDISTTNSNDLLIHPDFSAEEAADVMLQHGAVAIKSLLRNDTAAELRTYLSAKHHVRHTLPWNEVFWDGEDGTRLSLGIGTSDTPVITEALQQIGSNEVLKRTLQGIVGDDPAIVEIATLTSLYGAHDQGIHTDSDWFGSSLLYGRTFLHSYTMFIALQDTPESLGATTVCPGTHFCADQDLEQLCLENGAFSVSTNGETGRRGMLPTGDGFLFNQNVWHRGPRNFHRSHQDRVMFSLTFTSRNKEPEEGVYRRRQALGTYYYQRWNMWGATFNYLKDAGTAMVQPWSGLRALGLYTPSSRNVGILYVEQFSQQLANADDFYADDELFDFITKMWEGNLGLPNYMRSSAERWEDFLPETMDIWLLLGTKVYSAALCGGALVSLLLEGRSFWKRFALMHGCIALLMYSVWMHIQQTDIARSIQSGDILLRPFPEPPVWDTDTAPRVHSSTFPERHDVLIGTRFDADFLASFNRFLDFHPGNSKWLSLVAGVATLPISIQEPAANRVTQSILEQKQEGLPTRFLLQEPETGAWRIMTPQAAMEETQRAVLSQTRPLVGKLISHLKNTLADYRFGAKRDTAMARTQGPALCARLLSTLVDQARGKAEHPLFVVNKRSAAVSARRLANHPWLPRGLIDTQDPTNGSASMTPLTYTHCPSIPSDSKSQGRLDDPPSLSLSFQPGDRVWAYNEDYDGWYEANLIEQRNEDEWELEYFQGGYDVCQIRPYVVVVEGARVVVDFGEDGYFIGTIAFVHPDGRCSVLFDDDDNDFLERVDREQILELHKE